jgi:hypothetical protein
MMAIAITQAVNINQGDAFDVYCGRSGKGLDGYFGNHCGAGGVPRQIACLQYREHFYERVKCDPEFVSRIESLRGKRLGCFCMPKECHLMTIVEYLEGIAPEQQRELYFRMRIEPVISQFKPISNFENYRQTDIFG